MRQMIKSVLLLCFSFMIATAATYKVDQAHSKVTFQLRHLLFSHVNGTFSAFDGNYTIDHNRLTDLNGYVQVASISTKSPKRDKYLVSPEFFDVAKYPKMTMRLLYVKDHEAITEVTIKERTEQVPFNITLTASQPKPHLKLEGKISRKAFGLTWGKAVETGGVVVGDKVKIVIDLSPYHTP